MYRCSKCQKLSSLQEKSHTVVTSKRQITYYNVIVAESKRKLSRYSFKNIDKLELFKKQIEESRHRKIVKEYETKGWEIKETKKMCERCKNAMS